MTSNNLSKKPWNNNILVIGAGYIGTYLTQFLLNSNIPVIQICRNNLNYHDIKTLHRFILNKGIDCVINCSGFTGRPNVDEGESKKEECWHLNTTLPLKITELCNNIGVKYIHMSSGCIYSGYDKAYSEEDSPNFGLFDASSFYSKSKHAFEIMTKHLDLKILRLRMPICNDLKNPRNFLYKISKYPNLISELNSKTYIPDLCWFVFELLKNCDDWKGQDIYNVVNSEPLSTFDVVNILNSRKNEIWGEVTPNWVNISDLNLAAPRSNCVLDNTKASKIYNFRTETEILNLVGI